jgi:pimeloyl-ACP methyl ester carboxylesterase
MSGNGTDHVDRPATVPPRSIYRSADGGRAVRDRYLDLLDHWPVDNERLRVPTREGETFVVACGPRNAPPVLLLHGSGANSATWMGDAPAWAAHFRVYAVDIIGEPGLSAPARPPLASPAHALWLDDVMRGLGLTRAALVGMSLGGWLALDYAVRRPARVDRLALLSPSGIGRVRIGFVIKALLMRSFGRWGSRAALKMALGPGSSAEQGQTLFDFILLIFRYFRPRLDTPTFDDDTLRRLTMPTLVVVGGKDALIDSRETRRRLNRVVPHATVNLHPGAGHLVPDQTEVVLDFLHQPD